MKYGGNTSCVSVDCDGHLLIFDSGTGIRPLGNKIIESGQINTNLFFSHTHWDHISGFPFFKPAYAENLTINVYCGNLKMHGSSIFEVLSTQMKNPTFPVPIEILKANLQYHDFYANESFNVTNDIEIETSLLNHPKGATGYRVNFKGSSVCYITDTEHKPKMLDKNILKLIDNSDLVIYDSTYTDEEYPQYAGWGHSTWQEGIRLCRDAKAKNLAIFHHDPGHNDNFMDGIDILAKDSWEGAFVAKEGVEIVVSNDKLEFNEFDDKP